MITATPWGIESSLFCVFPKYHLEAGAGLIGESMSMLGTHAGRLPYSSWLWWSPVVAVVLSLGASCSVHQWPGGWWWLLWQSAHTPRVRKMMKGVHSSSVLIDLFDFIVAILVWISRSPHDSTTWKARKNSKIFQLFISRDSGILLH